MSRVFIVQDSLAFDKVTGEASPRRSFSPARQYGELVFIVPFRPSNDTASEIESIWTKLSDFGPDDYLLLVGGPEWIAAAGAIAAQIADGNIRILKWLRHERCYQVENLVLWESSSVAADKARALLLDEERR